MKTLSLLLSLSFFIVGRLWHVDMLAMSSIYQTSEIFIRVELNVEVVTRWEKQKGEEVYGREVFLYRRSNLILTITVANCCLVFISSEQHSSSHSVRD